MQRTIVLLVFFTLSTSVARADEIPVRTITTSGNADVRVTPDEVEVVLGVETRDKNLLIAKKANDERLRKIEDAIAKLKIDPKNVQTDYINIEPNYRSDDRAEPVLYHVRRSLAVTLKDTSKFPALLTDTLQAGANQVHSVHFRTTELRKHRDHARTMAIQAAREKAIALARELGQKVGKPRSIQEGGSDWLHRGGFWGRGYGQMAQNVVQNAPSSTSDSPAGLLLGQISVSADITVVFDLE
jgi:uncharacterized protein